MKKITIAIIVFIITTLTAFSQTNMQMWYKVSPEIRLNITDTPFEFRLRPDDHIFLPAYDLNYGRTDIMLGVNIWKFKVFSYSKFDFLKRYWTGARIDFNVDFFNHKLLLNIQKRFFFGLNDEAANHYYFVQFLRYRVTNNIHTGVLSYGKWETKTAFNQGYWFIGPSVYFKLPYNFNLHLALVKDIYHKGLHMAFFRLGYRINWKIGGAEN